MYLRTTFFINFTVFRYNFTGNDDTCNGCCKWFCTVRNNHVLVKTTKLQEAQQPLEHGNPSNIQAVIPMTDRKVGHPHDLPRNWTSGSIFWNDDADIERMQGICNGEDPICAGEGYISSYIAIEYSTPYGKTDKLEEPVNRELDVT